MTLGPNAANPNLTLIGEGFGFVVFFDRYESIYFRNGVKRKISSKPTVTGFFLFSLQTAEEGL